MKVHAWLGVAAAAVLCIWGGAALLRERQATAPAVIPAGPGSLAGIWSNSVYTHSSVYDPREAVLRTSDGEMPPLQQWATELLEKRIRASEAGHPYATTKSECMPSGVPQLMFGPRTPMQFLETPGQLTILIEEFNIFRIIRINAEHEKDPDPGFMGDSVGHWEGDTLVVDTIGLTDRTTLDVAGTPHSEALHVVERLRRAARDRLEVTVTLDDPRTFTKPWTAKTAFRLWAGERITEYFCENQRNPSRDGITVHPVSQPGS